MKFKLDENLSDGLAVPLARDGHDVSSVLLQRMGGHPDGSVFEACRREGRALITLDLDFNDPIAAPIRPPRMDPTGLDARSSPGSNRGRGRAGDPQRAGRGLR